ncbi:tyrosine-protein phosphatase [Endozoicomonas gorgoniicola]|uniref:Tyrosine-protein phosphatase n=1 Tax=Endozoicomonas gorgoniicola TaxID=1234144 RepID=A0ABT3MX95_9GAMM|nr:inositol phosphate phosphatase SopB [Endozoicomonas gorgoniicola]MCW7554006.1 tyrosine-protein phosphatase [Endozoicomonas gorgoniicola]
MEGNGSVGGVRNASFNPLDPAKHDEVVHKRSSRLNRAVKSIGVKLKILPGSAKASGKRQPAKRSIHDRRVEVSSPLSKQVSGVKPQVTSGRTTSARLDDLLILSQGEKRSDPEVRSQFEAVRNEYLNAALKVTDDAISEATESRGGELAETLKDIKAHLKQILASHEFEVTPESVKSLKNYPQTFASFVDQLGLSGDEVLSAFKGHVSDSDVLQAEQGRLQLSSPHEDELNANSTHNHKELFKLQSLQFQAAKALVADELAVAVKAGNDPLKNRLAEVGLRLDEQFLQLERTVQLSGDRPVSKDEVKVAKDLYPQLLKDALVEAGVEPSRINTRFQEACAEQLNNREWKVIHKSFEHDGRIFSSKQTPASQIEVNGEQQKLLDYQGSKGVSCADTKNLKHATNLLRTDFQIGDHNEFTGIRHGVVDPYGVKGGDDAKALKAQGARKKAEEILIAALSTKPELFQQALKAAETGKDIPTLFTTSTSLLTTGVGSGKEAKMQKTQNEAFKYFTAPGNQPVEIELAGPDGTSRKVRVNLRQSQFNIPVNWGGVGPLSSVFGGRRNQARMNQQAITDLVGNSKHSGEIGGMAAHWLGQYEEKQKLLAYKLTAEENRAKPDAALIKAIKQESSQLAKDRKTVQDLSRQIKDIYRKGRHHHEHKDAYKLAARVALLTHKLGGVPLINCKSGKDRTGMLDAEIKFLTARIAENGAVPEPGPLAQGEKTLFREILLKSGNHEVQEMNVGVRGYKTERITSIDERVGDKEVREEVRGLSKMVGL